MAKKSKTPKDSKTVFEKLNEAEPGFLDSVISANDESIKNLIVRFELEDKQFEEAKKLDTDLKLKKEELKIANETYSVPLARNRLKRRALAILLSERGKA